MSPFKKISTTRAIFISDRMSPFEKEIFIICANGFEIASLGAIIYIDIWSYAQLNFLYKLYSWRLHSQL